MSEYALPGGPAARPNDITSGPDGDLWFTEPGDNKIGRMDTSGTLLEEDSVPTASSGAQGIVTGSDQNIWFTENSTASIARLTLPSSASATPSATTPVPSTGAGHSVGYTLGTAGLLILIGASLVCCSRARRRTLIARIGVTKKVRRESPCAFVVPRRRGLRP